VDAVAGVTEPRDRIVDTIRRRVLRGIQAGAIVAGDRLPSARELAPEFEADYRVVIAAYKELAGEGLVELRPRGGVYVAVRPAGDAGIPPLPERWLAELLAQGLAREIPGPELHEWMRRSTETLRLRALVVATTDDQRFGLCRELHDDFGLEAEGITNEELRGADSPPLALRRADLIVTTAAHGDWVSALGASLRKTVTVIDVRADLVIGEWALLLRRPVYAVVSSPEFESMLRRFFAGVAGAENLRVLVLGRDDLASIPADAPTYVTQAARRALGDTVMRGRILPASRTISSESAREIFDFIVRANVEAASRARR
jgi:DNA-binding transcriptional regulator YhcF (GntR family)